MDKLDVYYGAFVDYRKSTANNKYCKSPRSRIARNNIEKDKIEVVVTECEILDDWIIAIEEGLDFIDKAIKEERQFILSNGEVVLIEKVKNVSKESVEHLAKHSDLITKIPKDGEELIPEKLYTVERLTDYAVYENRFLYMLLCYLRDFISLRYSKIVELTTTYRGKIALQKSVSFGDRKTDVKIQLDERILNDPYLWSHNSAADKINRIDGILKSVLFYLSHPLMEMVSKAPMLKPPITETNVLKMNKNFRGAVQLYYFVTGYEHAGYTYTEQVKELTPFSGNVGDEIAEIVELTSFLTYKHGMGIEEDLKAAYQERLEMEKKEAEKRKLERLQALRKRIAENGDNPEEYMLLLEERNKELEANSLELVRAKAQIAEMTQKIAELNETIVSLNDVIEKQRIEIENRLLEIEQMKQAHAEEIRALTEHYENTILALKEAHAEEIRTLTEQYENTILALKEEHENYVNALKAEHLAEVEALKASYEEELTRLSDEHKRIVDDMMAEHAEKVRQLTSSYEEKLTTLKNDYNSKIENANSLLAEKEAQYGKLQGEYEALTEEKYILSAKVNSLKTQYNAFDGTEDFNSREGFNDVERQYNYFKKFFKEQWKLTKKTIRKTYLKADPVNAAADAPEDDLTGDVDVSADDALTADLSGEGTLSSIFDLIDEDAQDPEQDDV